MPIVKRHTRRTWTLKRNQKDIKAWTSSDKGMLGMPRTVIVAEKWYNGKWGVTKRSFSPKSKHTEYLIHQPTLTKSKAILFSKKFMKRGN